MFSIEGEAVREISIHALREEGDMLATIESFQVQVFLSTPSARRATFGARPVSVALRYFYPRPPRGGRQVCFYGCVAT